MNKEIRIGLMGIIALVALYLGINFLKGSQLFSSTNEYHIAFKNAKGLTKSSTVFADGYSIGTVGNITYARPGSVVVSIQVNKGVKIPHGTIAQLDEAMLGGCTLNMIMGTNPANCYQPGDTIQGTESSGLMASVGAVMPQAQQLLARVDTLVMTLNALAANPALPQMLENTRALTENLNTSAQQLNKLLGNDVPALTRSLQHSAVNLDTLTTGLAQADLEGTLKQLNQTMTQLNEATAKLNSKDNNVGLLLNDTTLYSNLNQSVNSIGALLDDIKKRPSRYVNVTVFGRKKKTDE